MVKKIMDYDSEENFPQPLLGIDEAGRGCLAGPVVVAGVMNAHLLPRAIFIQLNDSKKLKPAKRDIIACAIKQYCPYFCAIIDHKTIDEINILQATLRGMQQVYNYFHLQFAMAMIDGNKLPNHCPLAQSFIGGDGIYPTIAAASIIAKTTRDAMMMECDKLYPQYHFAQHKGYGTSLHRQAIAQFGACAIHRLSFLRNL